MSGTGCLPADGAVALSRVCRDSAAAARLKTGSLLAILVASAVGICLPVALTRAFSGSPNYARGLLLVKCYAAGVILSTSLVHVLPDAHAALADCAVASRRPWRDFPFAGLFTLVGALLALLVDLSASSHLEVHAHVGGDSDAHGHGHQETPYAPIPKKVPVFELAGEMSPKKRAFLDDDREEDPAPHAATNGADPDRDDVALFGPKKGARSDEVPVVAAGCHGVAHEVVEVGEGPGEDEEEARRKQKMVSKVLEIGIVFHSVIIGVTMGMSQDVCAIRPLVVALSFHQVFEGMGLGGCIAQILYYQELGSSTSTLKESVIKNLKAELFCTMKTHVANLSFFATKFCWFMLNFYDSSNVWSLDNVYLLSSFHYRKKAGFGMVTVGYMCIMFSVTTPLGILLGMLMFHMTGYDDSNPNALIMEGILGSLSAGILIYMALVDLISLDFFHNKMMSASLKLKKACYIALVLGSASMSVLALWA